MSKAGWTIQDCSYAEADGLAEALGLSATTARVLVRRGYANVESAQRFLAGEDPGHDPLALGDMAAACGAIRGAIAARKRICVHGDYDVDGICATALAVFVLRELGAEVEWHLPSRFDEGYGLHAQTIERLADEGCGLVLTVDCGITAAGEVAAARARGLEVVVTDHHRPGDDLPDCPLVATRTSGYPFPELCGTGVVLKLGQALLGPGHPVLDEHLDLVALATVADVVPLVDENRSLVIRGLEALARTRKPGLRALMASARVDRATLDEGAVAFRLAPRLNAAGRLCRPQEALELLLTDDENEARRLADSLEELNRERQAVEERIARDAVAEVESWPEARRRQKAYVLACEEWHEGVIGIVASRLVERFHRPVVLIAGGQEAWKGSGRSIPAFDLHAALGACADHLERFGGHRAAAGLSIRPERIEAFAQGFAAHAEDRLTDQDMRPPVRIDAVVTGNELTLELCEDLRRLAPFGLGNPGVTLLLPACALSQLSAVGDGKHLRFRVNQRGRDSGSAIAFGFGSHADRLRRQVAYDVVFKLEANHWNGTVAPQLVVRDLFDAPDRYDELRAWLRSEFEKDDAGLSPAARTIFDEIQAVRGASPRDLLESPTFRSLLADEPLRQAA